MGPQYPKWVRSPGHPETVVDNESGEVELLAKWADEDAAAEKARAPASPLPAGNALMRQAFDVIPDVAPAVVGDVDPKFGIPATSNDPAFGAPLPEIKDPGFTKFDHDGNGKPGGSRKGGWPKGKPRPRKAS